MSFDENNFHYFAIYKFMIDFLKKTFIYSLFIFSCIHALLLVYGDSQSGYKSSVRLAVYHLGFHQNGAFPCHT